MRDWLHVEDHCAGLLLVLAKGRPGEKYNIGGGNERTNLEIVDRICDALEALRPGGVQPGAERRELPRARRRSCRSARATIAATRSTRRRSGASSAGRRATRSKRGLRETVRWYLEHRDWCEQVQAGRYDRERLGSADGIRHNTKRTHLAMSR